MICRVHYRISGWVEVEATDADEAADFVSDYTAGTLITETLGEPLVELDESEINP